MRDIESTVIINGTIQGIIIEEFMLVFNLLQVEDDTPISGVSSDLLASLVTINLPESEDKDLSTIIGSTELKPVHRICDLVLKRLKDKGYKLETEEHSIVTISKYMSSDLIDYLKTLIVR